ncbi:hypothetical protein [Arthrobacter polaris]|uniref:hypothetical protein n=1 Tax=Arthrobacter polaris TaxID=2813727 RepID=UPI003D7DAE83
MPGNTADPARVMAIAAVIQALVKEAGLEGIYLIRTSIDAAAMDAHEGVRVYKLLANVEKIFKTLKSRDLRIPLICHHTETRTQNQATVLIHHHPSAYAGRKKVSTR